MKGVKPLWGFLRLRQLVCPELPLVEAGFQPALPKIPMHILMFVLNFFKRLSDWYEVEALVYILYDTIHRKYTLRVPKQELTAVSVDSVMEEDYPDYLIHVMDIHSHNTMAGQVLRHRRP